MKIPKKTLIPEENVIYENVLNYIQSFISCFVDKTKILSIDKAYDKNCLKAFEYTVKVIANYHLY